VPERGVNPCRSVLTHLINWSIPDVYYISGLLDIVASYLSGYTDLLGMLCYQRFVVTGHRPCYTNIVWWTRR